MVCFLFFALGVVVEKLLNLYQKKGVEACFQSLREHYLISTSGSLVLNGLKDNLPESETGLPFPT